MIRRLPLLLLLAAVVLAVAHGWAFGNCLQDDAFISLRYARSLAGGHGLVYNPGEAVEGYTNFLWTVLLSLCFPLGVDPELFTRLLGLASGVGAVLATAWLARRLAPDEPIAGSLAGFLVAALPFFIAESAMGLETAAFAALSAAALAALLRESELETGRPWSALLLSAAVLTRPEGMLVSAIAGAWDLWSTRREQRSWRPLALRWATVLAVYAGHTLFRLWTYGDYVPNTARAKVGGGLASLARGADQLTVFIFSALPLLMLFAPGLLATLRTRSARWRGALPLAVMLTYIAYVVAVGGDYKPTLRFYATPSLLLAAFAALGLLWIAEKLKASQTVRQGFAAVLCLWAGAVLVGTGGPVRNFAAWRAQQLPVHRAAGRWLAQNVAEGTWLATGNAGVLPFYSGLPTIDMYGLCDRHIALREMPKMGQGPAGHEKGDGAYVLSRRPGVVLFQFARFSDRPFVAAGLEGLKKSVSERELWRLDEFRRDYELRSARLPGFYFNYFVRRESAP